MAASLRRPLAVAALAAALVVTAACRREEPPASTAPSSGTPTTAAGSSALPAGAMAIAPGAQRVDVVLVTIDTLRRDAVGFAGNARVATPLLDRLAAGGRVYTDAHAHNVVTLPSHTNILTGLLPFQHGVRDNTGFALGADVPTLATMLGGAGYATGAFVAAYPLDRRFGLGRGFDVYDDAFRRGTDPASFVIAERRGDVVVAAARTWWQAHADRPRFLWAHLYDPHAAYEPPEPWASRYRDTPYLGEVAATDAFLAPLLAPFLDGRERPAIVVVTADHGEALGDHGELTHGLFAYESTLAVPLVVWGDGVAPGSDPRPARHIDIAPTILARVGVAPARRLPGSSLLAPAPAGADTYFESLSTYLNRGWAPLRGLLRDGTKAIDLPLPELYALAGDPGEAHNLEPAEAARFRALRNALPRESAPPAAHAGRAAVSGEEAARLRSLGYVAGDAPPAKSYGPDDDPKRLVALDHELHLVIDAYQRGRYDEAITRARAVATKRPTMTEAWEHMALALRQLERHDEAIATLREARQRGAAGETLDRQLGLALAEAGQSREAVEVLSPYATHGEPETLRALGLAMSDSGDQAQAMAVLERALAAVPEDPQTLNTLGTAALRAGDAAAARRYLERAVAANDQLAIAWNTLGVALFRLEGAAPAIAAWQRAVALDPKQYDALLNIGRVAGANGDIATARAALERFVATAPAERYANDIAQARAALAELAR